MTKQEQLLALALSKVGTDFTNDYLVSDEVSCVFAVTTLLHEIDPQIPIMTWTPTFEKYMDDSPKFERIPEPVGEVPPGSIIISSTIPGVSIGHTGIFRTSHYILANNSYTGRWSESYDRDQWRAKYFYKGGLSTKIYKLKN